MGVFVVRDDQAVVTGTVVSCWKDAWTGTEVQEHDWHVMLQLEPGDARLTTVSGAKNALDMIECRVTPIAPYRDGPWAGDLLGEFQGAQVKVCGSWGDLTNDAGSTRTVVRPIAWVTVETLTPIVEEHGLPRSCVTSLCLPSAMTACSLAVMGSHRTTRRTGTSRSP